MKQIKQKSNLSLALLIFIAVFGITNIPNNYAVLGPQTIFWFAFLGLYFIPLALIIAEMGSYSSTTNSGISKWVELGLNKEWAYYCGWAYFIENIFYLPMLASRVPVFISWIFSDFSSLEDVVKYQGRVHGVITAQSNPALFLGLAFIVIIISIILSIYFENIFDKMGKFIGSLSLISAFGFILITIASVIILKHNPAYQINFQNITPTFNSQTTPTTISTLVWIIFAIGGVETIGSVIKDVDSPQKRLPKIVTIGAITIVIAYAIGVLGLTFILKPNQLSATALENAIPIMFAQAGIAIGLNQLAGIIFLKFIMFTQVLITISALVLWFVTTINVLFTETDNSIFPDILVKKNKTHKPINAMIFTGILITIFLLFSASSKTANVYTTLYNMSTISMVVPFILFLLSYINFKKRNLQGKYIFIKNKKLAIFVGIILFLITLFAFIFGVVDLRLLTHGISSEFISSFKLNFGGLVFFMLIGVVIYYFKKNIYLSILAIILTIITGLIIFL